MDNITIHAENVTLNVHSSAAAELFSAPLISSIDRIAEPAPALRPAALAAGSRFTKVFADGTLGEAGDACTDHVAVIDHTTNLMWSVESLGDPDAADDGTTQEHCIERCRESRLLGFDNWELPTRTQLAGLIDDTRHEPAIDTSLFPRVKSRWHWTSTPCAWSSASAWGVLFDGGGVLSYLRYYDGFALAVRRVGQ